MALLPIQTSQLLLAVGSLSKTVERAIHFFYIVDSGAGSERCNSGPQLRLSSIEQSNYVDRSLLERRCAAPGRMVNTRREKGVTCHIRLDSQSHVDRSYAVVAET